MMDTPSEDLPENVIREVPFDGEMVTFNAENGRVYADEGGNFARRFLKSPREAMTQFSEELSNGKHTTALTGLKDSGANEMVRIGETTEMVRIGTPSPFLARIKKWFQPFSFFSTKIKKMRAPGEYWFEQLEPTWKRVYADLRSFANTGDEFKELTTKFFNGDITYEDMGFDNLLDADFKKMKKVYDAQSKSKFREGGSYVDVWEQANQLEEAERIYQITVGNDMWKDQGLSSSNRKLLVEGYDDKLVAARGYTDSMFVESGVRPNAEAVQETQDLFDTLETLAPRKTVNMVSIAAIEEELEYQRRVPFRESSGVSYGSEVDIQNPRLQKEYEAYEKYTETLKKATVEVEVWDENLQKMVRISDATTVRPDRFLEARLEVAKGKPFSGPMRGIMTDNVATFVQAVHARPPSVTGRIELSSPALASAENKAYSAAVALHDAEKEVFEASMVKRSKEELKRLTRAQIQKGKDHAVSGKGKELEVVPEATLPQDEEDIVEDLANIREVEPEDRPTMIVQEGNIIDYEAEVNEGIEQELAREGRLESIELLQKDMQMLEGVRDSLAASKTGRLTEAGVRINSVVGVEAPSVAEEVARMLSIKGDQKAATGAAIAVTEAALGLKNSVVSVEHAAYLAVIGASQTEETTSNLIIRAASESSSVAAAVVERKGVKMVLKDAFQSAMFVVNMAMDIQIVADLISGFTSCLTKIICNQLPPGLWQSFFCELQKPINTVVSFIAEGLDWAMGTFNSVIDFIVTHIVDLMDKWCDSDETFLSKIRKPVCNAKEFLGYVVGILMKYASDGWHDLCMGELPTVTTNEMIKAGRAKMSSALMTCVPHEGALCAEGEDFTTKPVCLTQAYADYLFATDEENFSRIYLVDRECTPGVDPLFDSPCPVIVIEGRQICIDGSLVSCASAERWRLRPEESYYWDCPRPEELLSTSKFEGVPAALNMQRGREDREVSQKLFTPVLKSPDGQFQLVFEREGCDMVVVKGEYDPFDPTKYAQTWTSATELGMERTYLDTFQACPTVECLVHYADDNDADVWQMFDDPFYPKNPAECRAIDQDKTDRVSCDGDACLKNKALQKRFPDAQRKVDAHVCTPKEVYNSRPRCSWVFQGDGNLVLYNNWNMEMAVQDRTVITAKGAAEDDSRNYELRLQNDGNLVMYKQGTTDKEAMWATGKGTTDDDYLCSVQSYTGADMYHPLPMSRECPANSGIGHNVRDGIRSDKMRAARSFAAPVCTSSNENVTVTVCANVEWVAANTGIRLDMECPQSFYDETPRQVSCPCIDCRYSICTRPVEVSCEEAAKYNLREPEQYYWSCPTKENMLMALPPTTPAYQLDKHVPSGSNAQKCDADELWYDCDDSMCNGQRGCATNGGLEGCACPGGINSPDLMNFTEVMNYTLMNYNRRALFAYSGTGLESDIWSTTYTHDSLDIPVGSSITSQNGYFTAKFQQDCNLVVYMNEPPLTSPDRAESREAIWAVNMDLDEELDLDEEFKEEGRSRCTLVLSDLGYYKGKLTLYNRWKKKVWSSDDKDNEVKPVDENRTQTMRRFESQATAAGIRSGFAPWKMWMRNDGHLAMVKQVDENTENLIWNSPGPSTEAKKRTKFDAHIPLRTCPVNWPCQVAGDDDNSYPTCTRMWKSAGALPLSLAIP